MLFRGFCIFSVHGCDKNTQVTWYKSMIHISYYKTLCLLQTIAIMYIYCYHLSLITIFSSWFIDQTMYIYWFFKLRRHLGWMIVSKFKFNQCPLKNLCNNSVKVFMQTYLVFWEGHINHCNVWIKKFCNQLSIQLKISLKGFSTPIFYDLLDSDKL